MNPPEVGREGVLLPEQAAAVFMSLGKNPGVMVKQGGGADRLNKKTVLEGQERGRGLRGAIPEQCRPFPSLSSAVLDFPVDIRVYKEGKIKNTLAHQDFQVGFKAPPHSRSCSHP
jgi:hypothetical protein